MEGWKLGPRSRPTAFVSSPCRAPRSGPDVGNLKPVLSKNRPPNTPNGLKALPADLRTGSRA